MYEEQLNEKLRWYSLDFTHYDSFHDEHYYEGAEELIENTIKEIKQNYENKLKVKDSVIARLVIEINKLKSIDKLKVFEEVELFSDDLEQVNYNKCIGIDLY